MSSPGEMAAPGLDVYTLFWVKEMAGEQAQRVGDGVADAAGND